MYTGPPSVPPNWLYLNGARALPALLEKKSLALSCVLRKNSYKLPWNSLPPERVTTLNTPPADFPYSAEKLLVSTLNSCTRSGVALMTGWFCAGEELGAPSNRNSLLAARWPLIANDTVLIWSMGRLFTPIDGRTPGTSIASAYGFLTSSGSSVICLNAMTCPTVGVSLSSNVAEPLTSTLDATAPSCNVMSRRATCCTSS